MSDKTAQFTRPVRIPEHVPLGFAQPPAARAGERGSWQLHFALSEDLPPGERLFLQVYGGRNMMGGWRPLQIEEDDREGYVCMKDGSGERLRPVGIRGNGGVMEFATPDGGLKKDQTILVELGGAHGITAPKIALPNSFLVLLKGGPENKEGASVLFGKELERMVGGCLIHIIGNDLHRIAASAPSYALPGERISVFVRPEDKYGNVASQKLGRLLIKDFEARQVHVENSPCCLLTDIVLPKEGIYRLEIEDDQTGLKTTTNPIKCSNQPPDSPLLWGVIHCHTEISDGAGSLDHSYNYMKNQCGLDFGATSDHDHLWETSDDMWRSVQEAAARYNEPGRFTTFLGYEWAKWRQNGDGDRNVYYLHDYRPMYRSDDGEYPTPGDLFATLDDETAIVIPHHSANVGNHCDWKDHDPEKERLVEIYSMWGNSERGFHEGNPFPIRKKDSTQRDAGEVPAGFVQRALELGWRVGFTGGGDDHMGHPGDMIFMGREPFRYKAGLMAAYAAENTRQAIWDAMWNRRCYGTTGPRIIVEFHLDDQPMGAELRLSDRPALESMRQLRVAVHGTDKISSIEVVRNNKEVHVVEPNALDATFTWMDQERLTDVNLPAAKYTDEPFTFYYIRITQADGEMAWSSPIWILSG